MATRIPLPADIYYDALENFLLVTSLAQVLRWQESQTPPALSMAARNDIFDYAKMLLQPASYQLFLQCSEQLSWTLPQPAPAVLPLPEALQGHGYSQAELQAQAHLSGGSTSLWEAVRQTVALLEFDAPRQVMMQRQARAMSFHLGVCARGPMVGICKATPVRRNVCKLLTFFVKHILPEYRYTSLAINVNYITPPHRDVQNGSSENLIISLCQQHNSGLWVESPHGSDYAAMMSGPNAENETVQPMEIVAVPVSAPFQTLYLAEPIVDTSGNACAATGSAAVGIATGGEEDGGESMARVEAEEAGEISFLHLMDGGLTTVCGDDLSASGVDKGS
eukprot:s1515_g19.t1